MFPKAALADGLLCPLLGIERDLPAPRTGRLRSCKPGHLTEEFALKLFALLKVDPLEDYLAVKGHRKI
jgi:hypothetical protein